LPQEQDIKKIIKRSKHNVRVTLDLDEVVFVDENNPNSEKSLTFPLNKIFKERLKKGIPALFRFLSMKGYDIWVYTAQYYSLNYMERLFRSYHVHVDGIITGTKRKTASREAEQDRVKALFENKYVRTFHIANDSVVDIRGKDGQFEEREINPLSDEWSYDVMEAVKELTKDEA